MAKKMKWFDWLAIVLLIAGGLNWGTIAFFSWNFVELVFGSVANWVYGVVGLASVYSVYGLAKK